MKSFVVMLTILYVLVHFDSQRLTENWGKRIRNNNWGQGPKSSRRNRTQADAAMTLPSTYQALPNQMQLTIQKQYHPKDKLTSWANIYVVFVGLFLSEACYPRRAEGCFHDTRGKVASVYFRQTSEYGGGQGRALEPSANLPHSLDSRLSHPAPQPLSCTPLAR